MNLFGCKVCISQIKHPTVQILYKYIHHYVCALRRFGLLAILWDNLFIK
jgi:hypothetical protein